MRDAGGDGPAGQQPGGDLRVGQPLLDERGHDLGRRETVPAAARPPVSDARPAPDAASPERGLEPGDVRDRAQGGVGLHGPGEHGPRLAEVAGVGELPGRRLQRLRLLQRPAGVVVPFRGREQPGGLMIQQAAAVQRIGLLMRDLRSGGEGDGPAREVLGGAQVASGGGEPDGVDKQVVDLLKVVVAVGEHLCQRGERL